MAEKAKLKRYRNGAWEQYYPETTTDQVIGLEQLISSVGGAEVLEFTAVLKSSDWESASPSTQVVIIQGLLETDDPVIDLTFTGNFVQDTGQFYEWSKVYRITTQDNAITAFAVEAPTTDINIKLLVVR